MKIVDAFLFYIMKIKYDTLTGVVDHTRIEYL
jgi:hypothetical protein